jgi:hypothetical protein
MESPTSGKIGIGIVTCDRPELFEKCYGSVPPDAGTELVVVNDGASKDHLSDITNLISHDEPYQGVGKSKNDALKFLFDKGCDYFFLIEDDIYIKNPEVFQKYIEASKYTGIQHFNYSQHGLMNKTFDGTNQPNPTYVVDYGSMKLPLYPHCVGAFSFYTKKCINHAGFLDERYYNACEHVDHTYEIIKIGMHPQFWNFADIENSWEYLGDEQWSLQQSTISSKPNHSDIISKADAIFVSKHGCYPGQIPASNEYDIMRKLREIKVTHGI